VRKEDVSVTQTSKFSKALTLPYTMQRKKTPEGKDLHFHATLNMEKTLTNVIYFCFLHNLFLGRHATTLKTATKETKFT